MGQPFHSSTSRATPSSQHWKTDLVPDVTHIVSEHIGGFDGGQIREDYPRNVSYDHNSPAEAMYRVDSLEQKDRIVDEWVLEDCTRDALRSANQVGLIVLQSMKAPTLVSPRH